ncbi:Dehydrogenase/reductase SDR family member 1 [Heterocephalus glaber]|uniref:Dehydrogenase/reductase SDR family member 1 n=1 Tax=Heterocephalus glaber TaxID=10181 RepID=G5B279_HETGA|nr:Dehydrogenase/reductase SDR family member 1 [Heterocephalus glaber]
MKSSPTTVFLKAWRTKPSRDFRGTVVCRCHYLCSVYGAWLIVPAGMRLIVVISSPGELQHMFNVPYGVGKAACDRLAADCAHELWRHGVSYVSLTRDDAGRTAEGFYGKG